jgi:CheY-like chemotaxis protein
LIMPEVDGFEVLRQLRWSAPQLLGKTIVVTAAALRDVDKCPELELVWKFLRKPLDIEQLGASLLDCVGSPSKKAGRGGVYEMPPRP